MGLQDAANLKSDCELLAFEYLASGFPCMAWMLQAELSVLGVVFEGRLEQQERILLQLMLAWATEIHKRLQTYTEKGCNVLDFPIDILLWGTHFKQMELVFENNEMYQVRENLYKLLLDIESIYWMDQLTKARDLDQWIKELREEFIGKTGDFRGLYRTIRQKRIDQFLEILSKENDQAVFQQLLKLKHSLNAIGALEDLGNMVEQLRKHIRKPELIDVVETYRRKEKGSGELLRLPARQAEEPRVGNGDDEASQRERVDVDIANPVERDGGRGAEEEQAGAGAYGKQAQLGKLSEKAVVAFWKQSEFAAVPIESTLNKDLGDFAVLKGLQAGDRKRRPDNGEGNSTARRVRASKLLNADADSALQPHGRVTQNWSRAGVRVESPSSLSFSSPEEKVGSDGVEVDGYSKATSKRTPMPLNRKRKPGRGIGYSAEEDEALIAGLKTFGWGKWKEILHSSHFHESRTSVSLKDRARNLGLQAHEYPRVAKGN